MSQAVRVGTDCAVIHGDHLRQFLGGDGALPGNASGGNGGGGGGGSVGGGVGGTSGGLGGGGGGGIDGVVGVGAGGVGGAGAHAWWLESFAVRRVFNSACYMWTYACSNRGRLRYRHREQ